MDKLLGIAGGQKLRVDDWGLIQDQAKNALSAIVLALIEMGNCKLTGVVESISGGDIWITAGYIFIVDEIFYVPATHFTVDISKTLYLVKDFTTTENRVFKDTASHDVYSYHRYKVLYLAAPPDEGYYFTDVFTLQKLLIQLMGENIHADLTNIESLSYATGFAAETAYGGVSLQGNAINGYMLEAAFTATVTAGKLCNLPIGMRPSADLVGFFFNNSISPGILKIKKNGDVYVSGASTASTNYITFQFFMRFVDNTLFALPTGGGGPSPLGDIG